MRTVPFLAGLAVLGGVMAWSSRDVITENFWLLVPAFLVLVFAGVLHALFQRPGSNSQRQARLFGVGTVALLATGLFGAFTFSFVQLLRGDSMSFDFVWIGSAVAEGALASWLWLRFFRLLRRTET